MPPDYMHILSRYSGCLSQAIRPDWFDKSKRQLHLHIGVKSSSIFMTNRDLVVPIWPYQFFNALQSDRWSDPNTVRC